MSKHKTIESMFCPDCQQLLAKDKNREGMIQCLKSRDSEPGIRIPTLLLGPRVLLIEEKDREKYDLDFVKG